MYTMPQVLLVEDEPVTRVMIECRLRAAGYSVTSAPSGEAALALLGQLRFALMITDLYLDGLDGMALMAKARGLDPELELIVLTGGATLATALAGYDHGPWSLSGRDRLANYVVDSHERIGLERRNLGLKRQKDYKPPGRETQDP